MIRVILADDHAVVRDGLRVLLEAQSDLEVVGAAANGRQAVRLVHAEGRWRSQGRRWLGLLR